MRSITANAGNNLNVGWFVAWLAGPWIIHSLFVSCFVVVVDLVIVIATAALVVDGLLVTDCKFQCLILNHGSPLTCHHEPFKTVLTVYQPLL